LVGDSARYAGDRLLHESRRPGAGAQSRVEPASQGLQARGNNYYDNDKTLREKSFPLKIKSARVKFAGALLYVADCNAWAAIAISRCPLLA
jgi:hypothetical protein